MNSRPFRNAVAALAALAAFTAPAAELSAIEATWLDAALPVLRFGLKQGLPLDIVVQPQPAPGETPLGLAFVDGRCKLVLSMRGNPEAQATLDRIEPALRGPVLEAIVAHELGHCWRHVNGRWGSLPATLQDATQAAKLPVGYAALVHDMWRTRREEAFADLVGLAWTLQHHPSRYDEVHAWHVRYRAQQVITTGPHDTRVWIDLARDRARFAATGLIFEQVQALWVAGLLAGAEHHTLSTAQN